MLFYILLFATPIIAVLFPLFYVISYFFTKLRYLKDQSTVVRWNEHNHKQSWIRFGYTLLWGWVAGGILFFLLAAGFSNADGNKQVEVQNDTYTLAEGTELDVTSGLKFVYKDSDGVLRPMETIKDRLDIQKRNGDQVNIRRVDHHHTWLAPFPLNDKTYVVVK